MEAIWQWGLGVITTVQGFRTPTLDAVFAFFTFLGEEEFYLLLLPLLFWSVDFSWGARVGIVFLLSAYANGILKDALAHPRPHELNPGVQVGTADGYGLPSGHAQSAATIWGTVGLWARRRWVWIAAVLLAGIIGLSRVYLGVHFPTDVFAGWLLGAVAVTIYWGGGERVERWLTSLRPGGQVAVALVPTAALFLVHPVEGTASEMGALAGVGVGLTLTDRYAPFSAAGPVGQRVVRFILGAVTIMIPYAGLKLIFPGAESSLYLPFRFLRYALVGWWAAFGAPWLFTVLRLAPRR